MSTDIVAAKAADAAALIDVRAVAHLTGLSVRTIWRFQDGGIVPRGLKLGSSAVRWRRSDIDRWIADGCRPVRHVSKGGAK